MTNYKKNKDLINNSIIDARHVLDDAKPYNGIYKTLLYWILSYFSVSVILSLVSKIAEYNQWLESEYYFSIYRISTIVLFIIPVILYILSIYKIEMRLKEVSFLKTFSYVPLFISLYRILFPLSYYLNFDFLLALNNVIPMDVVFLTIGLFHLFLYFKDKKLFICIFLSVLYIISFSSINIILFQMSSEEITPLTSTLIEVTNYYQIINSYSLFVTIILLLSLLFIKKYGKQYS